MASASNDMTVRIWKIYEKEEKKEERLEKREVYLYRDIDLVVVKKRNGNQFYDLKSC